MGGSTVPGLIQIRFDGDIVHDNRISMRTLGNTLFYTQNALERAFLDIRYERGVYKHARMPATMRADVEFLVEAPQAGSYIQRFLSNTELGAAIADRLSTAIESALERAAQRGDEEAGRLRDQVERRKARLAQGLDRAAQFDARAENANPHVVRSFGDRSIAKEIDKVLQIIRARGAGDSSFELTARGARTRNFEFARESANEFHRAISERELGEPTLYVGSIVELDKRNQKGKFVNAVTEKTSTLHFASEQDFFAVHPHMREEQFAFIGAPLIEYGAYDIRAGDIFFLALPV